MNKFIETILEKKNNESDDGKWQIVFSDNTHHFMPCICGHKVKRITYIYHRPTKTVGYIGKTCVKKYGIQTKVSNGILLAVIKGNINNPVLIEDLVKAHILMKYEDFITKIGDCIEIDYYDIVAPFRRLLNDVCDLVSEYDFDLVDLLREIERAVESMNQATKHVMVDENDSCIDSLSDILSISDMDDAEKIIRSNNLESEIYSDIIFYEKIENFEDMDLELSSNIISNKDFSEEERISETKSIGPIEDVLEDSSEEERISETKSIGPIEDVLEDSSEEEEEEEGIIDKQSIGSIEDVLEDSSEEEEGLIDKQSIGSIEDVLEDSSEEEEEEGLIDKQSIGSIEDVLEDSSEEEEEEEGLIDKQSIGPIEDVLEDSSEEEEKETEGLINHEEWYSETIEPCGCSRHCYCTIKFRLWKMKQELNIHRDTIKYIKEQTALLVENTELLRDKIQNTFL